MHSSANDCILEWKLFEKVDNSHFIKTGPHVFRMASDYIIPASYLDHYLGLKSFCGVRTRYPQAETVFELELSDKATSSTIKYPNNFTGNAIEHLINIMIGAEEVDSAEYLLRNKLRLAYVGSVEPSLELVHTERREDGGVAVSSSVYKHVIESLEIIGGYQALVDALSKANEAGYGLAISIKESKDASTEFDQLYSSGEHKDVLDELLTLYRHSQLTDSITDTNKALKPEIAPLVDYLKKVLASESVKSQELVVDRESGCLALCDLSSETAVVEIKTGASGKDPSRCSNQLYISSAGRTCYLLHIDWGHEAFPWFDEQKNTRFVLQRITFLDKKPRKPESPASTGSLAYDRRYAIGDLNTRKVMTPQSVHTTCGSRSRTSRQYGTSATQGNFLSRSRIRAKVPAHSMQ